MRISYFPDPYPDELIYSMAARYFDHMHPPTYNFVSERFFGKHASGATIDFSFGLQTLIDALPDQHTYTVDMLIDHHTLYPFYAPFLPPKRAQFIREQMRWTGKTIWHAAGLLHSHVPRPQRLRYCPVCVEEEKNTLGECYWHRLHQITGVIVCPTHHVYLEESDLGISYINAKCVFQSAEVTIHTHQPRALINSPILLQIAMNAQWLLLHHMPAHDGIWHRSQCRALLSRKGYLIRQNIQINKFVHDLQSYYSSDLLSQLQIDIPSKSVLQAWFTRLNNVNTSSWQHPITHILLLIFLDSNPKEYCLTEVSFPRPFGIGPWPCLNPVCENYHRRCIDEYEPLKPTFWLQGEKSSLRALFKCCCGYQYIRSVQGKSGDDRYHDHVVTVGELWEQKLKTLWNNRQLSMNQISRILGVNRKRLLFYAACCNLSSSPEVGKKGIYLQAFLQRREQQKLQTRNQSEHRLIEETHCKSGTMNSQHQKEYVWLQKHDEEWLKWHDILHDVRQEPLEDKAHISDEHHKDDRHAITDMILAAMVRQAAQLMLNAEEFPTQITLISLCSKTGVPLETTAVRKYGSQTQQALAEVVESREQFVLRKIRWAASHILTNQRQWKLKEIQRHIHFNNNSLPPLTFLKEILEKHDWDELVSLSNAHYRELSEEQWQCLQVFFNISQATRINPTTGLRAILNGILWKIATQNFWNKIPLKYGSGVACYHKFNTLRKIGVWNILWEAYLSTLNDQEQQNWQNNLELLLRNR